MADKKMKQYLMRTYDLYWNNVVRETVVKAIDDDTAIDIARTAFNLLISPSDRLELQVCRKGIGRGAWCMFAAVYYDDTEIVVEDCYC